MPKPRHVAFVFDERSLITPGQLAAFFQAETATSAGGVTIAHLELKLAELTALLERLGRDLHAPRGQDCDTCHGASVLLGQPWGCAAQEPDRRAQSPLERNASVVWCPCCTEAQAACWCDGALYRARPEGTP